MKKEQHKSNRLAKGYQVLSVILQCLIPEFSETAVLWNIRSLQ